MWRWLGLGCILAGCGRGEPVSALVTTGWAYDWEILSHRIGYLRAAVNADSSLDLGIMGGEWASVDTPSYRMRFQVVEGAGFSVREQEATFTVDPSGTAATTLRWEPAPEEPNLVALIQGFTIDCDVPQNASYPADYPAEYGYTSQGFGFAAGQPVADGTGVDVPVTANVRWAPQDRDDMNAAILEAVTEVRVRVLLVATEEDIRTEPTSGSAEYPYDPPYTDQPPMSDAVTVPGKSNDGFVGWTAWELTANDTGPDAGEGDYLRSMGVEFVPTLNEDGAVAGAVTATISNSSADERTQLAVGFSGTLARVGVRSATVTHYSVEGTHPVGLASSPPTVDASTDME